ncbi:hypothetical protein Patl1_29101 [Pistacia atlantica]|uniref:Uncharacterized protein n=1 Tax=Pistacia atlantica TaxID=434234 RepID=A0ACC1BCQ6_9ROSI|nr:hypothetical protein Patl1_29101 [Pistacia atlantica]
MKFYNVWFQWEINRPSCFMDNRKSVVIRLTFGVVTQCWCSFITFPLYVIVTQMGSTLKKSVVSEHVRQSLTKWRRRVKAKRSSSVLTLVNATSTTSLDSLIDDTNRTDDFAAPPSSMEGSSSTFKDRVLQQDTSEAGGPIFEISPYDGNLEVPYYSDPKHYDRLSDDDDKDHDHQIASYEIREE